MNREHRAKPRSDGLVSGYANRRPPKPTVRRKSEQDPPAAKDLKELYARPQDDWLSQDEIQTESLKKLAQADVLRVYSFVRRFAAGLGRKWRSIRHPGTVKRRFKIFTLATAGLGVIAISFVAIRYLAADRAVLGEIDQIGFSTLKPQSNAFQPEQTKYDSSLGIATFQDQLGAATITVTQQLLPDDIAGAPDGVARLAATFEPEFSVQHLITDKGLAYLLRSGEGTVERVLFSHQRLLILATANQQIEEPLWIDYINRLQ